MDVAFCEMSESPGTWAGLTLLASNGTIHRYGPRVADGVTTLAWEEIGTSRGARTVNCTDYPRDNAMMFLTAGPSRPENEIHIKFREGIVTGRTDRDQGFGTVITHGRWNMADTWLAWSSTGFYEFTVNDGSLRFGLVPERFTTRSVEDTTFMNPASGYTIFAAALHNRLYVASSRGERDRVIWVRESGTRWQRFYQ